jgi:molybdate transport system ATP-binding protein
MAGSFVEARLKNIRLVREGRSILRNVDWMIRPGERWVLAGGNGAGKTQLLKLISGAVWPTPTGRESRVYHWKGEDWKSPFEVQDEIAYVGPERQDKYERYGWNHSVERIVGTGLYRTDIPLDPLSDADHRKIALLLRRLSIQHLVGRPFLTLSYGERRLTLLARALAAQPKLLLLDELLNGLDTDNRTSAMRWLESTGTSKLPWVLATHRLADLPSVATHALVLERGAIRYSGTITKAPLDRWLEMPARALRNPARAAHKPPNLTAAEASKGTASLAAAHDRAIRGSALSPRDVPLARDSMQSAKRRVDKSGAPLVRLTNASVYLSERRVLEGISLTLGRGDCWVVHGPNGSGKSTLLRAIYGDHAIAFGGSIERDGIVKGVPLEIFKRRIGFVAPHLQADHPQEMTVAEAVQSGRHASIGLNDPPTSTDRAAGRSALAFFGLARFEPRTLRELSYGQLRRVLFARAWINRPELLLLDEPFAGIDAPTRRSLLRHVEQLISRGTTVMMATHHREEWPHGATHELELRGGRGLYSGPIRFHNTQLERTGSS